MRDQVQRYVDSCKCATANPRNPKPPLKLRDAPTKPWKITVVDYKGYIGPQRWYVQHPHVPVLKIPGGIYDEEYGFPRTEENN